MFLSSCQPPSLGSSPLKAITAVFGKKGNCSSVIFAPFWGTNPWIAPIVISAESVVRRDKRCRNFQNRNSDVTDDGNSPTAAADNAGSTTANNNPQERADGDGPDGVNVDQDEMNVEADGVNEDQGNPCACCRC